MFGRGKAMDQGHSMIDSQLVKGFYRTAHSRANESFHRIWNLIVSLVVIGLGIATVFSCYSPKTTDLNMYTVSPVLFLRDLLSNTTILSNTTLQTNPTLQNNSSVNVSALGLPELYYFGISGVCKKWSGSNTTCNRTFPPNLDIPLTILQDLSHTTNASQAIDSASGLRPNLAVHSKAACALMATSLAWTLVVLVLVQAMPANLPAHIIPLLILLVLSFSSCGIYQYVFFKQAALYNPNIAVSAASSPLTIGPGFWVFSVYIIFTLLITPVTAFWTLIACLVLLICALIFLWLCWTAFKCMMICLAAAGSGTQTTTTYGGDSGGFGA